MSDHEQNLQMHIFRWCSLEFMQSSCARRHQSPMHLDFRLILGDGNSNIINFFKFTSSASYFRHNRLCNKKNPSSSPLMARIMPPLHVMVIWTHSLWPKLEKMNHGQLYLMKATGSLGCFSASEPVFIWTIYKRVLL